MRRGLAIAVLLVAWSSAHAQVDSLRAPLRPQLTRHDELTLLAGYHQGQYGSAQLGIGRNVYGVNRHPYDIGYYAGAELRVDHPELLGVMVGGYVDGGFAMGVHYIHYMEEGEAMEVFRPEIGIGFFKFKMTYAYNLRLSKPELEGVNTHMLSISYAFRLLRLASDDARRSAP